MKTKTIAILAGAALLLGSITVAHCHGGGGCPLKQALNIEHGK